MTTRCRKDIRDDRIPVSRIAPRAAGEPSTAHYSNVIETLFVRHDHDMEQSTVTMLDGCRLADINSEDAQRISSHMSEQCNETSTATPDLGNFFCILGSALLMVLAI
jgi:hypothetical protein